MRKMIEVVVVERREKREEGSVVGDGFCTHQKIRVAGQHSRITFLDAIKN